jgi:16S rRNA processing protein RimM
LQQYLPCGIIVGTHGVRGDVKADAWCDSPQILAALSHIYLKEKDAFRAIAVTHASVHKGMVLLHLEGCDSLDDAILWKGKEFYADRADIPLKKGAHFIADLIGLSVIDAQTDRNYGVITDVINRGASDIYEIKMPNEKTAYLPAVAEFVQKTDLENGVFVTPIPGIFDEWEDTSV